MIKNRKCPYCKIEMEKNIEELVFKCSKCNYEEEFSKIKLKEANTTKFCSECKKLVEIVMVGKEGYCNFCEERLYTLSTIKPLEKK